MNDPLLSDLLTPMTPEEATAIGELIQEIEAARKKVEGGEFPDWQMRMEKMAHLRIRASNSLKRGEMNSWVQANAFVEERIRAEEVPTWKAICQINGILSEKPADQVIRNQPIFLGPHEASPPEKLKEHLQYFIDTILPIEKQKRHPLVFAAVLQYWIASIHPFWDANGRTSVLVADWVNLSFGYFPQSFENHSNGMIAHFEGRSSKATSARAIFKVLSNCLTSYQAFLS